MAGASEEGFKTTVFPVTKEAAVIPAMMASGKFQGGMTTPTPSGMYSRRFSSPSMRVRGGGAAERGISRAENSQKSIASAVSASASGQVFATSWIIHAEK